MRRIFLLSILRVLITSGFSAPAKDDLNSIAERYAHLVLALGSTTGFCRSDQ
jgi:hypothetical protein